MSGAADAVAGLRMAVGTLTVFPVRVERTDRAAISWTMPLAPVVGLLLGVASAGLLGLLLWMGLSTLLAALLALGLLTLLTRALHLDGLADLADGLGSARPAAQALEVMKRSDIGPFGVLALVFTIAIQAAALAHLAAHSTTAAMLGLVTALLAGRLALTLGCRVGVPPARPAGLGAMVAETVHLPGAGSSTGSVLALTAVLGLAGPGWQLALWLPVAVLGGLAAAEALRWHAVRRLGGITGDVLGALCETATTAALLLAAAPVATLTAAGA